MVLIEGGADRTSGSGAVPRPTAPRMQYARAADGVSIACWMLGRGTPLVYLAGGPWSHVELWDIPECRGWYERLAQQRLLVRYDVRGTGLSERAVADYSLEALRQDVEAVVDRLDLARFALFGAADAGPVAIAYAARHPERVSHLAPLALGRDPRRGPAGRGPQRGRGQGPPGGLAPGGPGGGAQPRRGAGQWRPHAGRPGGAGRQRADGRAGGAAALPAGRARRSPRTRGCPGWRT